MPTKSQIIWGVLIFLLMITGMNGCSTYNTLVSNDEDVSTAWSQVENVYQRRVDLIPNLVNTVKGYAAHEKETLEGVIEARSKATSVNIKLMVVERYPDLKANENFLSLQAELAGTENRIAVERKNFNETVKKYNKKIRIFPGNLWANMFGFETRNYFESAEGADIVPTVEF